MLNVARSLAAALCILSMFLGAISWIEIRWMFDFNFLDWPTLYQELGCAIGAVASIRLVHADGTERVTPLSLCLALGALPVAMCASGSALDILPGYFINWEEYAPSTAAFGASSLCRAVRTVAPFAIFGTVFLLLAVSGAAAMWRHRSRRAPPFAITRRRIHASH